jgi:hypothetical protein
LYNGCPGQNYPEFGIILTRAAIIQAPLSSVLSKMPTCAGQCPAVETVGIMHLRKVSSDI